MLNIVRCEKKKQHNQSSKSTLTDKQNFELCQYARDNQQEYINWINMVN